MPPLSYCDSYKQEDVSCCERFTEYPDTDFDFGKLPYIVSEIDGKKFVPIVHRSLALVAELDISFLFPSPDIPSVATMVTGDIDNKLKTLFDALRIPKQAQELPVGWTQTTETNPLFCLLEDDSFISKVAISNGFCLRTLDQKHLLVIIHVKVKGKMGTLHNLCLIG